MTSAPPRPRYLLPLSTVLAVLAVGVLALYASPTPRFAADRDLSSRGPLAGRFGHGEAISRFLVLDPTQTARVTELVARLRNDVSPLRGSRRTLRDQMRAELESPQPNAAKIGELVIQAHSSRGALRSALQRFDKDLAAMLRPEQMTRYQEWKERRFHSGDRWRGRFGGRRGGSPRNPGGPRGSERDDRPL